MSNNFKVGTPVITLKGDMYYDAGDTGIVIVTEFPYVLVKLNNITKLQKSRASIERKKEGSVWIYFSDLKYAIPYIIKKVINEVLDE